jgi:hypothetical protein
MYKVIYSKGALGHSNLARTTSTPGEYGGDFLEREVDATDFEVADGFVIFRKGGLTAPVSKVFAVQAHLVAEIYQG